MAEKGLTRHYEQAVTDICKARVRIPLLQRQKEKEGKEGGEFRVPEKDLTKHYEQTVADACRAGVWIPIL